MNAEILTIGDEILIGQINNTNSVWIAKQLNLAGIKVAHMATVGDDEDAIVDALKAAEKRADFIFITGGLGPTKDDITKKTFAEYFNAELVLDEGVLKGISEYFNKRGKQLSEVNRLQAMVPKGCRVIANSHGTAPGMWMEKNNKVFIRMPGVPYEMEAMMTQIILPAITKRYKLPFIYHRTVLTQGIGESALAEIVEKWEDALPAKNMKLAYLPQTGMVKLRVSSSGPEETILKTAVDNEIEALKKLISSHIFGYENYGEESPTLEKVLSQLLRQRGETISLAESCTGGYVSGLITAIPGASEVFKGAIIPYTNVGKHELLNVDPILFETVGAVSKECVEALAVEVRKKLKSTYSIAISGIAGPTGATDIKPVGTVWVAVASAEQVISRRFQFGDHRQRNIVATAGAALNMTRKFILKEEH